MVLHTVVDKFYQNMFCMHPQVLGLIETVIHVFHSISTMQEIIIKIEWHYYCRITKKVVIYVTKFTVGEACMCMTA